MTVMDWLMPAAVLGTGAVNVVFSIYQSSSRASRKEMTALKGAVNDQSVRIHGLGERMAVVEERIEALPTDEDIVGLTRELAKLNREIGELVGAFGAVKHQVGVMSDAMMAGRG